MDDNRKPILVKDLSLDHARSLVKYADKMLHAILLMKLDGWLTREYDLPDQRDLLNTAIDYWAYRHKPEGVENAKKDTG